MSETKSRVDLADVATAVIGMLYLLFMPAAFIVVEVAAATLLSGWVRVGLWVIVVWNMAVVLGRISILTKILAKGETDE